MKCQGTGVPAAAWLALVAFIAVSQARGLVSPEQELIDMHPRLLRRESYACFLEVGIYQPLAVLGPESSLYGLNAGFACAGALLPVFGAAVLFCHFEF